MKPTYLLLAALVLSGCGDSYAPSRVRDANGVMIIPSNRVSTVRIEGCEYIQWYYDGSAGMSHKGNCSNPIHYPCDTLR